MNLIQFSGVVWRYTAVEQAPLDIERSLANGGRFNPRLLFSMLYTSTSIHGAKAELIKSAKSADRAPELLLPKMLYQIEVNLHKVICDAILSYSAADPKHKNVNLYIIDPNSVAVVDSTKIQTMADWDSIKPVK